MAEHKDGLPSTDFSRMNREWVKAVAGGGSGGGVGLPAVSAADNGKILGVVNGAWGAMEMQGGGDGYTIATVTVTLDDGIANCTVHVPYIYTEDDLTYLSVECEITYGEPQTLEIPICNDGTLFAAEMATDGTGMLFTVEVSGNIQADGNVAIISGDGTILIKQVGIS